MTNKMVIVKRNLTVLLFETLCLLVLVSIANGSNCGTPRDIKDATNEYTGLRLPNGRYKSGAKVTYTCGVGFTKGKDSNGTYTCLKGRWTGDADNLRCCKIQICIDPDLFCVLPHVSGASPDILAGNSSFPIDKGAKMAYGIGTVVNFNCNQNYLLSNDSTVGPFECMRGGSWSSDNFTICHIKECEPPPTVENAQAEKFLSWESGNPIGTQYKYVCASGYETTSAFLNMIRCSEDLKWTTSFGFGHTFNFGLPKCQTKYAPSSHGTNYGTNYGSNSYETNNYGSGYSSGSGYGNSRSSTNNYNYSSTNRRQWTPAKTIMFVIFIAFIIIFCVAIICARLRHSYEKNSRTRAVIVNGVMTTEYVGPTSYTAPPPTLMTGRVIFSPPSAPPPPSHESSSYPMQGGNQPPETFPLTAPSPRGPTHFNEPPPSYNDVIYKQNTTPSAPH